ncbi:MAG: hypothetical protein JSW33_01095, partial [bacterium]
MQLRNCVLLLISSFNLLSQAQTIISPGDVSGSWPISGSPYLIQGDILIPADSTLTIEPGVTVEFQGHYTLNVQGRLLAIGAENDTILFTVSDTSGFSNPDTSLGGWNSIRFIDTPSNNDSSKFNFCRFQYGKAVSDFWHSNAGGALCIIQFGKINISHCLFIHNSAGGLMSEAPAGGAIHLAWSNVKLSENTFRYNRAFTGGAIQFHDSDPQFSNNIFTNNFAQDGGGIAFGGGSNPRFTNDQITYNRAQNRGGGIIAFDSTAILENVEITQNKAWWGGGIGVYNCEVFLDNCLVANNRAANLGGGIHADFSKLHLRETTILRDTCDSGSGGIHA